jgi:hypothetical protein
VDPEVVIISDDEEDPMIEEDVPKDEESMATPTPTHLLLLQLLH